MEMKKKTGKWILEVGDSGLCAGEAVYPSRSGYFTSYHDICCSECGFYPPYQVVTDCKLNFCPSCGADMRKEEYK